MNVASTYDDELRNFSKTFDTTSEDKALSARGHFLLSYPLKELKNITIDEYVIGKGTASFCACVEAKTKAWANIQGATANKFGIYYGKTKSDPTTRYRYTKKFGNTKKEAFNGVKNALLKLIQAGKSKKYRDIDENPLSQMFKAKILSLYFPSSYLNICSAEHLKQIALGMGIQGQLYISEYQHLLIEKKMENKITKNWTNPKFMSFLYSKFIRGNLSTNSLCTIQKPRKKSKRPVNFEDININGDIIGKLSEEYAIEWERKRLVGIGYEELVKKIEDRRDIPSYGYDYLSFNAPGHERYIEVKSVGREKKEEYYRFFLSENERAISIKKEYSKDYYFYLVIYGKNGMPCDILVKHAKELYSNSEITPCAYVVRFNLEDHE
ncbi:DUF3883 domain-containing protein [Escherichia coli]|nr:DUF3883 domain-containing protein [Escherichia coli]EKZ9155919.1 DUF3883 domain-containing protein [Escherichia coli]